MLSHSLSRYSETNVLFHPTVCLMTNLLTQTCKKPWEKKEGEEAKTRDLRNVKLYTSLPRGEPQLLIFACLFLFFVCTETAVTANSYNRKVSCYNSPREDNDKHKLLLLDTWHLHHLSPSPQSQCLWWSLVYLHKECLWKLFKKI